MKKLITMLVLLGITSVGISAKESINKVSYLDQILATEIQTVELSSLKNKLSNSGESNQCVSTCLNQFRSCISTAQGTGAWWLCELKFEKCMTNCNI